MSPTTLSNALGMVSGLLWTLTYIAIIRQGWRDRTYAMPFVAMAANLTWEFLFTFFFSSGGVLQERINGVWFVLDLVILFTYLKFWSSDYPPNLSPKLRLPRLLVAFAAATGLMIASIAQLGNLTGAIYSAFADNLMMSVLFISLLVRRGDSRGQSMVIAVSKMLGTAAASISQYLVTPKDYVLDVLFIEIFIFDLVYTVMLARAKPYVAPNQREG